MTGSAYDEILDAQSHYRALLDAMARPGNLNALAPAGLPGGIGFSCGSAYISMTLLGPGIGFSQIGYGVEATEFLRRNTAAVEVHPEKADFIFATAEMARLAIRCANPGTLTYPETSATVIVSVPKLGTEPNGGTQMTLSGPGIAGAAHVFVEGFGPEEIAARSEKNCEYPVGIDLILVCDTTGGTQSSVLCLPRTTNISTNHN